MNNRTEPGGGLVVNICAAVLIVGLFGTALAQDPHSAPQVKMNDTTGHPTVDQKKHVGNVKYEDVKIDQATQGHPMKCDAPPQTASHLSHAANPNGQKLVCGKSATGAEYMSANDCSAIGGDLVAYPQCGWASGYACVNNKGDTIYITCITSLR